MRKSKAFTLIELLAVIVILGVILSISVVAVNSIKKKQDEENLKNVISSILTGAKRYCIENSCNLSTGSYNISVDEILNSGYVSFDESKYSFSAFNNVTVRKCSDTVENLKQKIYYEIKYDSSTYNDCGCVLQNNTEENIKICKGSNGVNN